MCVQTYSGRNLFALLLSTEWVSAFDKEYIGMKKGSRLCSAPKTCWDYLDFTYFQTFVTIPRNWALSEFSIKFSGMDDGSRVSVYNSGYVTGSGPKSNCGSILHEKITGLRPSQCEPPLLTSGMPY